MAMVSGERKEFQSTRKYGIAGVNRLGRFGGRMIKRRMRVAGAIDQRRLFELSTAIVAPSLKRLCNKQALGYAFYSRLQTLG
jgi:hypothetical protein